jgi:ureidoglycolate dehydrogenase (NAD+)
VSTAPLSMAMPSVGHASVVLDMAAGAISVGALIQARRTGALLDEGVAMDAQGLPTRDPQAAQAPLPLGGPKGSGLALMSELLCSVLAGAPILAPALQARPEALPHTQNALVVAIDVAQLGTAATMTEQVESLKRALKALPSAHGDDVLLPGERGDRAREFRLADGIALPEGIRSELTLAASEHGVEVPW